MGTYVVGMLLEDLGPAAGAAGRAGDLVAQGRKSIESCAETLSADRKAKGSVATHHPSCVVEKDTDKKRRDFGMKKQGETRGEQCSVQVIDGWCG